MAIIDDAREFNRILGELTLFKKLDIQVGFPEPELNDEAIYIAQVAAWQEFGTDDIPERPFLSLSIDSNHGPIRERYKEEINRIIDGKQDAMTAARRIGIFGANLVRKQIRQSPKWAEPNADVTIDQKGSSKPLVDTGEMLQSVGWVVMKSGVAVESST